MKEFLAQHSYLIIWILALVIIGSAAVVIVQLNGYVPTVGTSPVLTANGLVPRPAVQIPAAPIPPPSVTFTIEKSKTGNTFVVQWSNLPSDTTALNIFRSKTNTNQWSLWKTVVIPSGEIAAGNADIDLGTNDEAGYQFEVQAVSGNGTGSPNASGTSSPGQTILWTSSSTTPGTGNPPSPVQPPTEPPSQTPSSTASSTSPTPPPAEQPSSSPNRPTGTVSQTPPPSGNPYYNPQVQISGYGTAPGSFWVEHQNQSIEIGWQNIPANVDTITIARSASSTGPWSTILIQHDPGSTGSYSLGLIDDTVNDTYYYEMTALDGTSTIATYGPVELTPND